MFFFCIFSRQILYQNVRQRLKTWVKFQIARVSVCQSDLFFLKTLEISASGQTNYTGEQLKKILLS